MPKRPLRFESSMHAAAGHALTALHQARQGKCRDAMHWLGVAQRELLRAADEWPSRGVPKPLEPTIVSLEDASDEVIRRCARKKRDPDATRALRRRRR